MMVKEFAVQIGVSSGKEEGKERKEMKLWRVMENPELSLGPSAPDNRESADGRSPTSAVNPSLKRKFPWDLHLKSEPLIQTGFGLQLKDSLGSSHESRRMYYMNRNSSKKSCTCPKAQKLDLDLNISTISNSNGRSSKLLEDPNKASSSSTNMVAVACLKCHLLVILHTSSPSCPNCKYLHSFPTRQSPQPNSATTRPMETLSLLN